MNTSYLEPIAFAVECHRQGRFDEAERVYREILEQRPHDPDALHLMGMLAHDTDQQEPALAYIARAISLRPNVAYYHSNLGNVLQSLERYSDAVLCYEEALRLDPDLAEAHNNLGNALSRLGRAPEAMSQLLEALRLKPDYHEAYGNLAHLLLGQNLPGEAVACYQQAARLKPEYAPYAHGLVRAISQWGDGFRGQNDNEKAAACYRSALCLDPAEPDLHLSLAHSLLITGDFAQGWEEFEWRWRTENCPNVNLAQPLWDGSPLNGRSILLWAEQGLGDTIQFVRYAELVKARDGVVLVECQPGLERLLRTAAGIDQLIPYGAALPDFDLHAPLQSLPRIFGTTPDSIPARIPYLAAEPERVRDWAGRVGAAGFKAGLVWAGNPTHKHDAKRSIAPELLSALCRVPGVAWFSLQKDMPPPPGVTDLAIGFDFADTAAAIQHLDLVVSADTSVAHLAGALGKPVWTLLPFAPDHRWFLEREDSPWYPTMRLFRQLAPGDWPSVMERVSQALEDLTHAG